MISASGHEPCRMQRCESLRKKSICGYGIGAIAIGLAACAETPLDPTVEPHVPANQSAKLQVLRDEFPSIDRVALRISATGPLTPGSPVSIEVRATANLATPRATVVVYSLDDVLGPEAASTPLPAGSLTSALALGETRTLRTNALFARPGYYRILAVTRNDPSQDERPLPADTTVLGYSEAVVYVLIEEDGGASHQNYDYGVMDSTRVGRFGPFGAFRSPREQSAGLLRVRPSMQLRSSSSSESSGYTYTGYVNYNSQDAGGFVGVGGAKPLVFCSNDFGMDSSFVGAYTYIDGSYSVTCDSSRPYMDVTFYLEDPYANVRGRNGAFAGAFTSGAYGGDLGTVYVVNDHAAHIFTKLRKYVPIGSSRFSYWRGAVNAYVDNQTQDGPIHYAPSADTISYHKRRVWTEDGLFVTVHEYGHAYHWVAVEPPRSSGCSGSHSIHLPDTRQCAFVEGFADFYAVWLAGDELTTGWNGGYTTDYDLERNPFAPGSSDGSLIEGPAAAFFYDLVDGAGEPDGAANEADGDEPFDLVAYPGSYVAGLMKLCAFTSPSVTSLDGVDEFVYCAENTLESQTLGLGAAWWRSYGSVSPGVSDPPGWNRDNIRTLWRRNLFNVQ